MRRIRALLVATGTVLLIVGCQPSTITWTKVDPSVPAPNFTLPQLDGNPLSLSDLRGKIVVMEFWATWCGPCRFSTPSLDHMYRKYRDKGLSVLLINQAEEPDKVRDWIDGRFEAPVLLDRMRNVGRAYGIRGVPQLFVIDPQGQVVYRHGGYSGGLEQNVKLIFEELTAPEPEGIEGDSTS